MIKRTIPIRILLVDDEAYMRTFVSRVLQTSIDCTVVEARDGQEAVALSQSINPELIILDINMPRMDGVTALGLIRKAKPYTPILMLTSISEEAVVEECVNLEASYFILKDIRADQLTTELQQMLAQFFPDQVIPHEQSQAR